MVSRSSTGSCSESGAPPIFIVGPSRSGTTLLRGILNNHPDVWITGETHYFDDLRPRLPRGVLSEADGVRCEEYFLGLRRRYGLRGAPEAAGIERLDLGRRARAHGGTADSYFAGFCRLIAERHGRERWGEKTPRHVFRIDEILALWPSAKILCVVRDPRAVAASYRDWTRSAGEDPDTPSERRRKRWSYHPILSALLWTSALRTASLARGRYGADRIHLQQFENLVRAPADEISRLCEWLELDFQRRMLDVEFVASSYPTEGSSIGVKQYPADRWRTKLPPADVALVQWAARRTMRELSYDADHVRPRYLQVTLTLVLTPVAAARAFVVNRRRLGKPSEYIGRRVRRMLARRV